MSPRFHVVVDPAKCRGCHLCICVASPVFSDPPDHNSVLPVLLPQDQYQECESQIQDAVLFCPEEAITMIYPDHRYTAQGVEEV
jgi:ferredoxin